MSLEPLPENIESNNYLVHASQTHQKDPQDPGAPESTLKDRIHHLQPHTHLQAPWETQVSPGCPLLSPLSRLSLVVKEKTSNHTNSSDGSEQSRSTWRDLDGMMTPLEWQTTRAFTEKGKRITHSRR